MIWGSASRNIDTAHERVKEQTKSAIKVQEYIVPDSKNTSIACFSLLLSTMCAVNLLIPQILIMIRVVQMRLVTKVRARKGGTQPSMVAGSPGLCIDILSIQYRLQMAAAREELN